MIADMEGRWDEAIVHYQQSLPRFESLEDAMGMAQTYHNLGMTYARQQNWQEASECYDKSFVLGKDVGEVRIMAATYVNRADLYLELSDLEMSEELARRALEIFIKLDDKFGQAEVSRVYGRMLSARKDWRESERFFQESIELFEECEYPLGLAKACHAFGLMCADKGDKEKAQNYLRRASQLFEKLGARKNWEKVNQDFESL
jgi:tetratricopeptide (TPR) repeat protein